MPIIAGETVKAAHLRVMGKVLACEISGRLYQGKSKHLAEMEREQLIAPVSLQSKDRLGVFTCSGWELTLRGHLLYCMSC